MGWCELTNKLRLLMELLRLEYPLNFLLEFLLEPLLMEFPLKILLEFLLEPLLMEVPLKILLESLLIKGPLKFLLEFLLEVLLIKVPLKFLLELLLIKVLLEFVLMQAPVPRCLPSELKFLRLNVRRLLLARRTGLKSTPLRHRPAPQKPSALGGGVISPSRVVNRHHLCNLLT